MFGEMAKLTEHMYHVDQTPVLALPSTVLLIRQKLFFHPEQMDDKTQGEPAKTRSSGKRPSKQMYNFGSRRGFSALPDTHR